ncbi:Serine/threonine-protein kinase Nek3 (NimA-related protein kinase 3) (AtNek3) [Durusdinium trenchii]|uniref:non-specific serine/threonine protein kinase n=1 Tax=Durusdinium trenchii TaxID=1381693 RepID=A0ABP0QG71_9DINO
MWHRAFDDDAGLYVNHWGAEHAWQEHYDQDGALYFYNLHTGETSWDLPDFVADETSRPWPTLEPENPAPEEFVLQQEQEEQLFATMDSVWDEYFDEESGHSYFVHRGTGESAWTLPEQTQGGGQENYAGDVAILSTDCVETPLALLPEAHGEAHLEKQLEGQHAEHHEMGAEHDWSSTGQQIKEHDQDEDQGQREIKVRLAADAREECSIPQSSVLPNSTAAADDRPIEELAQEDCKLGVGPTEEHNGDPAVENPRFPGQWARQFELAGPNHPQELEEEVEVEEGTELEAQGEGNNDGPASGRRNERFELHGQEGNENVQRNGAPSNDVQTDQIGVDQSDDRTEDESLPKDASQENATLGNEVKQKMSQGPKPVQVRNLAKVTRLPPKVFCGSLDQRMQQLFELFAQGKPQLSRREMLRELVSNSQLQTAIRDASLGLQRRFRPSSFRADFGLSMQLSIQEFTSRCIELRETKRELVPYAERKRRRTDEVNTSGQGNNMQRTFETLLIRVELPNHLHGKVPEEIMSEPYSHFDRRKRWETSQRERAANWDKEQAIKAKELAERRRGETSRRTRFQADDVRLEAEELRSRQRYRAALAKENQRKLTEFRARRATALLSEAAEAAKSQALQQVRKTKTKVSEGSRSSFPQHCAAFPNSAVPPSSDQEAELEKVDCLQAKLGAARWEALLETESHERQRLEAELERRMDRRMTQAIKSKQKRSAQESQRRKEFDRETAAMEQQLETEKANFKDQSAAFELVEHQLRKLEDKAFLSLQQQRQRFLQVASGCFDRGLMRRLRWVETLKEFDNLNRTVFHVQDGLDSRDQVLITCPFGNAKVSVREVDRVLQVLRVFQLCCTPQLLSAEQRRDDRVPSYSKHLCELTKVFAHRAKLCFDIFMLVPFFRGGRLCDWIERVHGDPSASGQASETRLVRYGQQLASGLRAMHARDLVHLGVDPSVIFFDCQGQLKLGLPKDIRTMDRSFKPVHLTRYSAPELVESFAHPDPGTLDRADVWSLGSVLYHAASGEPAPRDQSVGRVVNNPALRRYGRWFRTLLRMTLQRNPEDRASSFEVVDLLRDAADEVMLSESHRRAQGEHLKERSEARRRLTRLEDRRHA